MVNSRALRCPRAGYEDDLRLAGEAAKMTSVDEERRRSVDQPEILSDPLSSYPDAPTVRKLYSSQVHKTTRNNLFVRLS